MCKDTYRQHIWSFMEENEIALFPRPVFNRIPNFRVRYMYSIMFIYDIYYALISVT